jgi:hypothetical protein
MATPTDASDRDLLAALRRSREPEALGGAVQRHGGLSHALALGEVVRRYGGLVHGVCLRRGDAAQAGAACVAVFRTLLQRPETVKGALPLWLHATAMARGDGGPGRAPVDGEPAWQALAPALDPAIAGLAPLARWHLLLALGTLPARGHGRAQAREVAGPLAEPIAAALAQLAAALAATGSRCDGPALAGLLERNLIELPPPAVAAELGKLALGALPARDAAADTPLSRRTAAVWSITIGGLAFALLVAVAVWALAAWHASTHPREAATAAPAAP